MFDKLKDALFYSEEEEDSALAVSQTVKSMPKAPMTYPGSPTPVVFNTTSSLESGNMKEQLQAELLKATEGSAYGKYKKMNLGLKVRIPDNAQRTVATAASLEFGGVTKEHILIAANDALTFLTSEANSFETEAFGDLQNSDSTLAQKTEEILTAIAKSEESIKNLQAEITNLQKQKMDLETTVAQTKGSIEVSRIQFQTACGQVRNEIDTDIKEITLYLGGS